MSVIPLVACGIFRREVAALAAKNGWTFDAVYLDAALHNNLGKLSRGLTGVLRKRAEQHPLVLYGCCHPLMKQLLAEAGSTRTPGQNCVEMLLGREVFERELERGAYFLLEGWALAWDRIMREMFGNHPEVAAELFRADRSRMVAIRTPCSGDFVAAAERAARMVELPLEWMDCGLEHLEQTLAAGLDLRAASSAD